MKLSLSLVFLMFTLMDCIPVDDTTLDFGNKLDKFSDCLIQLVLNDFEGEEKLITIHPVGLPILLSRRRFVRLGGTKDVKKRKPKCDSENYRLENEKDWYLFRQVPSPRLNCFVQVFVDAISCQKRGHAFDEIFYTMNFRTVFQVMENDQINGHYGPNICCTFYIHVGARTTAATEINIENGASLHYFDKVRDMNSAFHIFFADSPTQLFFWTEYVDAEKYFVVKEEAIIACADLHERVDWLLQNCQAYPQTIAGMQNCLESKQSVSTLEHKLTRRLIKYSGNSHNREALQNTRLVCLNDVISYTGNMEAMLSSNLYLNEWKDTKNDVEPNVLRIIFPNSTILHTNLYPFHPTVSRYGFRFSNNPTAVSSDQDSIHFITCVPISKPAFLSLVGYVSAFNLNTWLMIALCLILSILVNMKKHRVGIIASTMLFYNVLVAQSTSSINLSKWLTGGWVLAGMFLTYNYQGNNIDQLTSPIPPKKLETLDEVFSNNLSLLSLPFEYAGFEIIINEKDFTKYTGYWEDIPLWYIYQLTIYEVYQRNHLNMTIEDAENHLKRLIKTPTDLEESRKMMPFDYYVKRLSKCKRSVFVDKFAYVHKMRHALRKVASVKQENIATSKTPYGRLYQKWISENSHVPRKYFYVRLLYAIQSGIVNLWQNWKFRLNTWSDTVESAEKNQVTAVKGLSIDGNIVVVFYLHIMLLMVCNLSFEYEFRKYLLQLCVWLISLAKCFVTICISFFL